MRFEMLAGICSNMVLEQKMKDDIIFDCLKFYLNKLTLTCYILSVFYLLFTTIFLSSMTFQTPRPSNIAPNPIVDPIVVRVALELLLEARAT